MASKHATSDAGARPEDDTLLLRLKDAINQDNPAAVMCLKTAVSHGNEDQWARLYSQLDTQHRTYLQRKSKQHSQELHKLQELVRKNLAKERRLLDEQLANHRSALVWSDDNIGLSSTTTMDNSQKATASESRWRSSRDSSPTNLEDRRHLHDHLSEIPPHRYPTPLDTPDAPDDQATPSQLRAALAARTRELALAQDRLARSRRQCECLLGRLTAAEAELQFLRNQRASLRSSASRCEPDEPETSTMAAANLRDSLADLERRQLIDASREALELPDEPAELERRYDSLQTERREVEAALARVPGPGSLHHTWHSVRDRELLEKKLDTIDNELVRLRNSLKQFHLI